MGKGYSHENDPNIIVELTEEIDDTAIRVVLGNQVTVMTARSAVDLQRKLTLAILDWSAAAIGTALNLR